MFHYGIVRCANNMKKILNGILMVLKFILLILGFGLSFFIILSMYKRIDKNIIESIPIFIPFILVLFLFFINIIMNQKSVNSNIFYNLTCCLVFCCILVAGLRSVLDKNMLLNSIMGYNINFSYFSDFIAFMKIMLYGLSLANIFFMIHEKEEKPIATKIDLEVL